MLIREASDCDCRELKPGAALQAVMDHFERMIS